MLASASRHAGQWWQIDLGELWRIRPDRYTLRHGYSGDWCRLRSWVLEGARGGGLARGTRVGAGVGGGDGDGEGVGGGGGGGEAEQRDEWVVLSRHDRCELPGDVPHGTHTWAVPAYVPAPRCGGDVGDAPRTAADEGGFYRRLRVRMTGANTGGGFGADHSLALGGFEVYGLLQFAL